MILIETPPLSSAKTQSVLAPIVSESEVLGKGDFGVVFGPYTASKMRDIMTRLYRPPIGTVPGCVCTPSSAVCAACLRIMSQQTGIALSVSQQGGTLKQVLPDGVQYILKVE